MKEQLSKTYDPKETERKLYDFWEKEGFFKAKVNKNKKPYTIVMPPPNVTGKLHIGHALDASLQDTIIRFKRMQGFEALWVPGTDHAAIATEAKIVEQMRKEGISKEDIGREEFLKRAWKWKNEYGNNIVNQLKKLGVSCDWSRERFTMDEGCSKAVREFFVHLYEKGLIYKGEKIINWCPKCHTSISDSEVNFEEQDSCFWNIKYPIVGSNEFITVATTRPETMFGDVAIAVNPDDERYKHLSGKNVKIPLVGREIPIIFDEYVDMEVGTGALKITPAHDPNDFEVGLKHNLGIINVMDESAVMNENAGKYQGLDRYSARKILVNDLENNGFIDSVKKIKHNVGVCYRCDTTVEPRVSKQWFVKMKELSEPAIDCVKSKKTNFIPDRFSKIYYHWMENIKDWCISRQLWWGHRIPVWYCKECGKVMVSREDVHECTNCGTSNIYQDEDTLDTWFSAGLWPLSVLGWPEKTPELDYFYPTNVIVTGYDIIFFWVAKMIFSSIEIAGIPPFENILIHGLLRDSQGRKMSKSLGNGIDPIEIIDKYGADALRFSLILGTSPGNDMRFFYEKVESSRNFANKIWNAARFVHMNVDDLEIKSIGLPEEMCTIDCWIVSRINKVSKEIKESMDKFELGIAAQKLYDFIWDEFCDWYIEFSKISGKKEVLLLAMTNILKLLHPFMPFITEEIWMSFPHETSSIMISKFPEYNNKFVFENSEKNVEVLMSVIKSVRNLRREMNVPQGKKASIYIETSNSEYFKSLENDKNIICKLATAKNVIISGEINLDKYVAAVNDYVKIYIPTEELVDISAEKARLKKELEASQKQLIQAEQRINNKKFISNAPKEIVDGAMDMYNKLKNKIEKLEKTIEEFSN